MKKDNSLTKSEYQVMDALWSLPDQRGFIPDIIKAYPDPKPAYTTMSTFLKILKEKGYVKSEMLGKMLYYTAAVKRDDYTRTYMTEVKNRFFGGSFASLVSFFAEREKLSQEEVDQLVDIIKKGKK